MADKAKQAASTETSAAQGRFTVSIPKELAGAIDRLIASTAKALQEATGVGVELSRAQMVESLIKSALVAQTAREAATVAGDGGLPVGEPAQSTPAGNAG